MLNKPLPGLDESMRQSRPSSNEDLPMLRHRSEDGVEPDRDSVSIDTTVAASKNMISCAVLRHCILVAPPHERGRSGTPDRADGEALRGRADDHERQLGLVAGLAEAFAEGSCNSAASSGAAASKPAVRP